MGVTKGGAESAAQLPLLRVLRGHLWTWADFLAEKSWTELLKSLSGQHKEHTGEGSTKLQNFFIISVAKQLHFGAQVVVSPVSQGE